VREIIVEGKTAMVKMPGNSWAIGVVSESSSRTPGSMPIDEIFKYASKTLSSMPLGSIVRILIEVESPKGQVKPEDNVNEAS